MARRARRKSRTGIYHVILRGIDRQIIFEDNEDYRGRIPMRENFNISFKTYRLLPKTFRNILNMLIY